MEDTEKFLLPTASRAKISHLLSYPVGAERISEALAETPQASSLKLQFLAAMADGIRDVWVPSGTAYEFLRIEYLNDAKPAEKYPIRHFYPRPPQYRWEIIVQPVFRIDRHKVTLYIIKSALPKMREWLQLRATQLERGSEVLAFFFKPEEDIFFVEEISEIQPLRRGERY